MCVVSAVMDQYAPWVPQPQPYTAPWTPPLTYPAPNGKKEFDLQELKRLLESFHEAVEAAEAFDALTGQPDCVDPEKAALLERVEELERRVAELEELL